MRSRHALAQLISDRCAKPRHDARRAKGNARLVSQHAVAACLRVRDRRSMPSSIVACGISVPAQSRRKVRPHATATPRTVPGFRRSWFGSATAVRVTTSKAPSVRGGFRVRGGCGHEAETTDPGQRSWALLPATGDVLAHELAGSVRRELPGRIRPARRRMRGELLGQGESVIAVVAVTPDSGCTIAFR